MSMRWSTKRELSKLREICHFLMEGKVCFFCKKPLLTRVNKVAHGDSLGSPIDWELTIHHVDNNHDNNEPSNKRLAHRRCHKSYHMKLLRREGVI